MSRITRDESFLLQAVVQAMRGTCIRRRTGCILTDEHGYILSAGYNGRESGAAHCIDSPCVEALPAPGLALDSCQAIHAEANALVRLKEPFNLYTLYCTVSPCFSCLKLLMGTSAKRIVFIDEYPHPFCREFWLKSKPERDWIGFPELKKTAEEVYRSLLSGLNLEPVPLWDRK